MKSLFQKWLFLFVALAFIATFGISWYVHRKQAERLAVELLKINLLDAAARVTATEENLRTITEMSAAAAIAKARAFAMLIKENPSIIKDRTRQEVIRKELDVDELHVSDERGKLIVSLAHGEVKDYIGYKMDSNDQSKAFMRAINDPDFELVQEPRFNGAVNKLFQYAGVARRDRRGIVQIGYSADRIREAAKLADVKKIGSDFRIGRSGKLFITENKGLPRDYQKTEYSADSLKCSCVCGKYLLSAEIPFDEVYDSGNIMLNILFFGIMLIFGVIFVLVSKLLQKLVINEISSVTDSLDEISRGENPGAVIHVGKSTELQKLAKSVNNTIQTLKKTVESGARHFKAELGITKMLQQSALPEKLPEHKHYRICAEMFNAEEVSGNFYDFFTLGKDYVVILTVDVSSRGTDAILYMIMVKNFFRQTLQKHSPEEAFNLANEEFCKSGRNMPVMAFLGVLNLNTGVMLSFNASSTFPVIKSKDGLPRYSKGMLYPALGESPENHYSALPIQLYSGDKLLLYSDAVIEAKNSSGERYGEELLLDRVLSLKGSAEDLIKSIHQSVLEYSECSAPADDIVLVTLEYT